MYICTKALESQDVQNIGDAGKIVKIDKSKFEKHKYRKSTRQR
jgi:hypothetical protein